GNRGGRLTSDLRLGQFKFYSPTLRCPPEEPAAERLPLAIGRRPPRRRCSCWPLPVPPPRGRRVFGHLLGGRCFLPIHRLLPVARRAPFTDAGSEGLLPDTGMTPFIPATTL